MESIYSTKSITRNGKRNTRSEVKFLLSALQAYSKFRADNMLAHNQQHSSSHCCAHPGSHALTLAAAFLKSMITYYFKDSGLRMGAASFGSLLPALLPIKP